MLASLLKMNAEHLNAEHLLFPVLSLIRNLSKFLLAFQVRNA